MEIKIMRKRKSAKRKTLKERGRELRKKTDLRGEAVLNIKPKRGMWLCNPDLMRVYGKVLRVNRDGTVTLTGSYGVIRRIEANRLYGRGYEYTSAMPIGEGWAYRVELEWVSEPPANWPYVRRKNGDIVWRES